MKTLLIGLLALSSVSTFANPVKITCDSHGVFGLGNLTRVELNKHAANTYQVVVLKEVTCGIGTGCMQLRKFGSAKVDLFESPTIIGALVTEENDDYNDFRIDVRRMRCKIDMIYSGGVRLKFQGKIVDLNY